MNLYSNLQTLLNSSSLLWLSEGEYPIQALRWPLWKLWGWQKLGRGTPYLAQQCLLPATGEADPFWQLDELLQGYETTAYRKPTGKAGEYRLVLAVRQGLWWVGISCLVIET